MTYSSKGNKSLFPKDAALNLPRESYSHGIRKLVAQEVSKSSFNEALITVKNTTGISLPKRTVEELAQKAALDFDAFYQQQNAESIPQALHLIILTTEGKRCDYAARGS